MAADKKRVEESTKKYDASVEEMREKSLERAKEYETGEAYKKSVDEGKKVAQDIAGGASSMATSQAMGAGRAAGLTPAQAAALAGQQTANTYANTASQQQGMQQGASMGARQFGTGLAERTLGNVAGQRGAQVNQRMQQQQMNNQMAMDWLRTILMGAGSFMTSDERLKTAYKTYKENKTENKEKESK